MENNEQQGLTEAERQEAIKIIKEAQRREQAVRSNKAVPDNGGFRPAATQRVSLVCLEGVEEEEVRWLYRPYIPRGKLTLCAAYPGTGKTYLLCYMAACVSVGRSFFGLIPLNDDPARVIYLTAEDGIGDTIKKRLTDTLDRIAGALYDISNVLESLDECIAPVQQGNFLRVGGYISNEV